MRSIVYGVIFLLMLTTFRCVVDAELEVCLKELGCLHGTLMPGYKKEAFEAFMGIPYAQPPIGEWRFKSPVAAAAWTGVLDASVARSHCLQKCYFMENWPVSGEEDCLYLNVYRPAQRTANPLPVMVYIHSGGFFCGSACPLASGPDYLMDTQQVIVVTVSYRLGPFGFLSTGDAHMPGNFGLKDQRLALKWVQQHIASFGGDAQLVTIFGHSAGGISTHLHMLSPNSKGLFQRAMSLSSTALMAPLFVHDPLSQAQRLAEQVGVAQAKSLSSQDLAAALRKIDGTILVNAGDAFKDWHNLPILNYGAVVEQDATPDSFINEVPLRAHLAGQINQVPWLLGSTSTIGEGSMFLLPIYATPKLLKEFNENFLETFAMLLYLPPGSTKDTLQEILKLYEVEDLELNKKTLAALSAILGDFIFAYPLYVAAASYSGYAQQPVSIYSFDYSSPISYSSLFSGGDAHQELGASHLDDALHTLRMSRLVPDYPKDSEDDVIIQRMTSLLVEFAKNGNFYNGTQLQACKSVDFTADEICNYFRFGQLDGAYRETVERRVDLRALALWKKLYTI